MDVIIGFLAYYGLGALFILIFLNAEWVFFWLLNEPMLIVTVGIAGFIWYIYYLFVVKL
jgi:hypothetical protein